MKIGFFSDSYKPYLSGVVNSIASFTSQLREKGHEVYIFAPDYPEVEENEYIYRFKSVPAFTNPGFRVAIPITFRLTSEVEKLGLDIIHTHSPFIMGWVGRMIAGRLDLPLVFTYHTLYEEYAHYAPFAEELAGKIAVKFSKRYCQACDLVITPSEYVQKVLADYGITTPLITIPTGVELEQYQREDPLPVRKEYAIKDDSNLLLFVGRLGREKNVEFLLRCFRLAVEEMSALELMLVGDGPLRSRLEELAGDYGLEERVSFTGLQPPERVPDFYRAADLFVFPSLTETQGLVTLEAMAGGLPVVAVNAAGSRVMVDDGVNGLLVEEDEHQFAGAIVEILRNEDRYNTYVDNALRKAEELSMANVSDRLIKAYRGLLADRAGYSKYLA